MRHVRHHYWLSKCLMIIKTFNDDTFFRNVRKYCIYVIVIDETTHYYDINDEYIYSSGKINNDENLNLTDSQLLLFTSYLSFLTPNKGNNTNDFI